MSDDNEPVEIENAKCIRQTSAAILCVIGGREVWIPQSQVHDDSEVFQKNQEGTLVVTAWFARQEGFE